MTTLFVSDLHLSADRPHKLELFSRFVERAREVADDVYVLGDLFEVWVGDDDDTPAHTQIVASLRALTDAGVRLHIALGNRDFLCGRRFAQATGATLLPDYCVIDLDGQRTLLTHGDLLCTRDVKYQKFRRVVRNPLVRLIFLAIPLDWRKRIALKTQSQTKASMVSKADEIMDVEQITVAKVMSSHQATLLIHGHTHRPDVHQFELGGQAVRRIVLGDWYEQDHVLVCRDGTHECQRIAEFMHCQIRSESTSARRQT